MRTAAIEATAHCAWHCCPSLLLVTRFVLNAPMALHGHSTTSCPTPLHLCVIRFGTRSLWRFWGLNIRRGPLSSTCGLMVSAWVASPCFPRPRFELGLSSRVPQVSAKRVRHSRVADSPIIRHDVFDVGPSTPYFSSPMAIMVDLRWFGLRLTRRSLKFLM